MKNKAVFGAFVLAVFLLTVIHDPVSSSYNCDETFHEDVYYFEDVDIFIIGRCRTIFSTGKWVTGVYIGYESYVGIEAAFTPLERLHIVVKDGLVIKKFFPLLFNVGIDMNDVKGIFFAGVSEQFSAGLIPFIVFVRCHAERLWIHDYHFFP